MGLGRDSQHTRLTCARALQGGVESMGCPPLPLGIAVDLRRPLLLFGPAPVALLSACGALPSARHPEVAYMIVEG